MLPLLLSCALGLTACAKPDPPPIRDVEPMACSPRLPAALLSCPRPYRPPVVGLQSDLVAEVLDPMWEGWRACHAVVMDTARWDAEEAKRARTR